MLPVAQQQSSANGSGVLSCLFQWAKIVGSLAFPYFFSDTLALCLHFVCTVSKHEGTPNPVMNRIIIISIIKIIVFGVKAISIHLWTCFTCGLSLRNHLSCPCCTKNWPRVLHVLRKNFPAARCRLSDTGLRSRGAYGGKWLGNNFTGHVVRKNIPSVLFALVGKHRKCARKPLVG